MNIYRIVYVRNKGFEVVKDKVESCHPEGYFFTNIGKLKFYFINSIPEKKIFLDGYDRITFVFLDKKLVRRFFNLMKEKLIESMDFEINEMQANKEKIVNSELYYETDD